MNRRWRGVTIVAIVALLVVPTLLPETLLFPYSARSNGHLVRSSVPIDNAALDRVTARANALAAASPMARPSESRRIFLTDGGWRWTWLALRSGDAFGFSRPGGEAIVMNRSDVAADKVWNGARIGGTRSLSGTLAHEICHGMIRNHVGVASDWQTPIWLREGYCDYVARESSLSASDVAALRKAGIDHPALPYYEGRTRVAAELRRNGGNVDALFAAN